jgi:hypothetical protein
MFKGIDGDDPQAGQYPAALPKNPKITCQSCQQIILTAHQYTKSDFSETTK